jgi:C1A family cysteine protease
MDGISHYAALDIDETGDTLKKAVQWNVISLGVDASSWSQYSGGVMTKCKSSFLNHGVALVGWGHDDKVDLDYFIVKNSWGARWGESGYIRMGINNQCGNCEEGTYPEYRC